MTTASWKIVNDTTGEVVEDHPTPFLANRAMLILSAHELKNGRVANYRVNPPIDMRPVEELNLPPWVLEQLEKT